MGKTLVAAGVLLELFFVAQAFGQGGESGAPDDNFVRVIFLVAGGAALWNFLGGGK